jgi:hypothetical protein
MHSLALFRCYSPFRSITLSLLLSDAIQRPVAQACTLSSKLSALSCPQIQLLVRLACGVLRSIGRGCLFLESLWL